MTTALANGYSKEIHHATLHLVSYRLQHTGETVKDNPGGTG